MDYEAALILLDSPEGQQLAASMSDDWAVRCSQLLGAFEPQVEPSWCAIAAAVVALRVLMEDCHAAAPCPTQLEFFEKVTSWLTPPDMPCHSEPWSAWQFVVKRVATTGKGMRSGVSVAELVRCHRRR